MLDELQNKQHKEGVEEIRKYYLTKKSLSI